MFCFVFFTGKFEVNQDLISRKQSQREEKVTANLNIAQQTDYLSVITSLLPKTSKKLTPPKKAKASNLSTENDILKSVAAFSVKYDKMFKNIPHIERSAEAHLESLQNISFTMHWLV